MREFGEAMLSEIEELDTEGPDGLEGSEGADGLLRDAEEVFDDLEDPVRVEL